MNKFRKLGFINYNGHIEVHSSLLNSVLHKEPKIERAAMWILPAGRIM
jgi:CRP/FNR family transcriptional regulator, cyclic AMP receptor protein